jgi:hypothetical protein
MEQISSLFKLLTEEQKKELKTKYRRSTNTGEKLIHLLLTEEIGEAELLKKLSTTALALTKIQVQAADILTEYIQQHTLTPFDEAQVIQLLLKSGGVKAALKLFHSLEKEYEGKQLWALLDNLYTLGYTIAQTTKDITLTESIAAKRSLYAAKHSAYVKLQGEILIETVSAGENKQPGKPHLSKLQKLNKQAYEIAHYELIHHSLVLLFNHFISYYNQPDKTQEVVNKIAENRKKFSAAYNAANDAAARLANATFLCTYEGYGSPEAHVNEAWKRIDYAGENAKSELMHALLNYYLCEGNTTKAHYYLGELEKVQDKKSFAPFKSMVMAITSFIENNYTGFKLNIDMFYNDHATVNSPALEAMMRIMELLILKHDKEEKALKTKISALKLFVEQNLHKKRYSETYDLLEFIGNPNAKNKTKIEALKQSHYRSSRMLAKYVFKEFK